MVANWMFLVVVVSCGRGDHKLYTFVNHGRLRVY